MVSVVPPGGALVLAGDCDSEKGKILENHVERFLKKCIRLEPCDNGASADNVCVKLRKMPAASGLCRGRRIAVQTRPIVAIRHKMLKHSFDACINRTGERNRTPYRSTTCLDDGTHFFQTTRFTHAAVVSFFDTTLERARPVFNGAIVAIVTACIAVAADATAAACDVAVPVLIALCGAFFCADGGGGHCVRKKFLVAETRKQ